MPHPLTGTVRTPGDKSISHRALIIGSLAIGETTIYGLSHGEDVIRTKAALSCLGVQFAQGNENSLIIQGRGIGGLIQPICPLNLGNSGTGTRLLMGAVASQQITTQFTGDSSLSTRPMDRVIRPLEQMGAEVNAREDSLLPLTVKGSSHPIPIQYQLPVPSAQVKSAILIAALNTPGLTTVVEPILSRDHTERMLNYFQANITEHSLNGSMRTITIQGESELNGKKINIPGDPSSAAFIAAAALVVPGSDIRITNVGSNPLRTGFFDTVKDMGAKITSSNQRIVNCEPLEDLRIQHSGLSGIEVPPERAPKLIDEYPVLAALAATAEGVTVMRGARELRLKESDRITAMVSGLRQNGVQVEEFEDGLAVQGLGGGVPGGANVISHLDHRVAMSFLILGMSSKLPIAIDDAATINSSFPEFISIANKLGGNLTVAK